MKYKYLEICERSDKSVVERMDVSNESDRNIERVQSGILINLNRLDFFVRCVESDVALPVKLN